ncbi:hypothetical protein BGZ76_002558 [Entomortierella beljakovae]|nr:hypothetical protein BGZ76_002558 [Entomortierella beljakovae]
MTTTSTQFFAFFGATGGCTNACLAHTLNAGLNATALARTPLKLVDMLLAQRIPQSVIDSQLNIVKGDISDVSAVKNVLLSTKNNSPVIASQIISGIGAAPQMHKSIKRPVTMDNPEICATITKNVIQALKEIYNEYPSTSQTKPLITVISSTGVSDVREDVPFGFRFLYHVALADPHKDKKEMERLITENMIQSNESSRVFRGAIVVRPSLLKGTQDVKKGKGWKKLKIGQENKPAVGYTVCRSDVGQWIFEEVVKNGGEQYFGQKVTLTN